MTDSVHRSAFLKRLVAKFPEIEPRLEGYRVGLHLETGVFRDFTQEAIDRGDMKAVESQFGVANWALENGNRQVKGALRVSYLEDLELRGKNGRKALELMPAGLRHAWRNTHEYLGDLLGKHDPKGQLAVLPDRLSRKTAKR